MKKNIQNRLQKLTKATKNRLNKLTKKKQPSANPLKNLLPKKKSKSLKTQMKALIAKNKKTR